jgi:methionyl-tRNA formyltransferase
MTDLPFGRGGSPLQNLIERGIYETKISALKVVKDLDAGPIYFKRDLTLDGSATEIFCRASDIIFHEMIPEIIKNEPELTPQKGKTTIFKRRIPEQGDISNLTTSTKVYDYIRMLDAEGYPPAFVETSKLKIEFSKGKLNNGYVSAQAKIKVKNE